MGKSRKKKKKNDDDCLHGMDGNGLKSNRQSAHFGDCVVSV